MINHFVKACSRIAIRCVRYFKGNVEYSYHQNGTMKSMSNIRFGRRNGRHCEYYANNRPRIECYYVAGVRKQFPLKSWHVNGNRMQEIALSENGTVIDRAWNECGALIHEIFRTKKGELIREQYFPVLNLHETIFSKN